MKCNAMRYKKEISHAMLTHEYVAFEVSRGALEI